MKTRALLSLALLLGFYLVTILAALALSGAGVAAFVYGGGAGRFVWAVMLGLAAILIFQSALSARPPPFVAPGPALQRDAAPGLFALLDQLAREIGTTPPADVYLSPALTVSVTEVGGFFGGRRVLVLGAPLFNLLSRQEMRSVLAHELGHFAGGDTRLLGLDSFTHAAFGSVLRAATRDPFREGTSHRAVEGGFVIAGLVGRMIVDTYAHLYFRVMRPLDRRMETRADALSARVVGGEVAARALEKVVTSGPIYHLYLRRDVGFAITKGAMPTDVWSGFEQCRDELLATPRGLAFLDSLRGETTDPYDTHPALPERLAALRAAGGSAEVGPDAPAHELVGETLDLEAWLFEAVRDRMCAAFAARDLRVAVLRPLPWASIAAEVYTPTAREAARKISEALHPLFPRVHSVTEMFAEVLAAATADATLVNVVLKMQPALARLPVHEARASVARVYGEVLGALFQGALLERGATVDVSFGASCLMLRLDDHPVAAALMAADALRDEGVRAQLAQWADKLGGAAAA